MSYLSTYTSMHKSFIFKRRISFSSHPRLMMILEGAEAFGFEYGMILKTALYLLLAQILYVCLGAGISLPGSSSLWLLIMYLVAAVVATSYDIYFFNGLPTAAIPQQVRTCTDLAVYFVTASYFHLGDGGNVIKAGKIAQAYVSSLGPTLSVVFFISAFLLSNCAFVSCVRFLINVAIMAIIAVRKIMHYFGVRLDPQVR